jgi:drug/metabolite transporter (DMT)-like permease
MISLFSVLTLSILGTVVSMFIFNTLIHHTGAVFAASTTYIMPIFALLWGILDGESLSLVQIQSMLVILAGVYMVNHRLMKPKLIKA